MAKKSSIEKNKKRERMAKQYAARRSRLKAELAEEALVAALDTGADASQLEGLLVESRLLDYAGMKFQYAVEISDAWKQLGTHPTRAQLDNDFDNIVISQLHGKIPDLMEAITELKPQYRQAWLDEYTSYRMAVALGRWDAEYEFWRQLQARLYMALDSYDPERGLPEWKDILASH